MNAKIPGYIAVSVLFILNAAAQVGSSAPICNATIQQNANGDIYVSGASPAWADWACINNTVNNQAQFASNGTNEWISYVNITIGVSLAGSPSTTEFYSNVPGTVLKLNGSTNFSYRGSGTSKTMLQIRNTTIKSWNNKTNASIYPGTRGFVYIIPANSQNVTVEITNSRFSDIGYDGADWKSNGVTMQYITNSVLNNVIFNGGYRNLYMLNTNNVTIKNSNLTNATYANIHFTGSNTDNTIENSTISSATYGIYLNKGTGTIRNFVVKFNEIYNNGNGTYAIKIKDSVWDHNHFYSNGNNQISNSNLSSHFESSSNITVSNNNYGKSNSKGIQFNTVLDSSILSNTIDAQWWASIYVSLNSNNITIARNNVTNTSDSSVGDNAIVIRDTNNSNLNNNNLVDSCCTALLLERNAYNNTIENNTLLRSGWSGLLIDPAPVGQSGYVIENNTIRYNTINGTRIGNAIEFYSTTGTFIGTVQNNRFEHNIFDTIGYGADGYSAVRFRNVTRNNIFLNNSLINTSFGINEWTYEFITNAASFNNTILDSLDRLITVRFQTNTSQSLTTISRTDNRFYAVDNGTANLRVAYYPRGSNITLGQSSTTFNIMSLNGTAIPESDLAYITITAWNTSGDHRKNWTVTSENSSIAATYTIGDFPPDKKVGIKKNGAMWNSFKSNSTGYITFTYSGEANIRFDTVFVYNVSGYVKSSSNMPIQGVIVSYPGGSAATDAAGYYLIQNIPNGTYSFSASNSEYASYPVSLTVSGQDSLLNFTVHNILSGKGSETASPFTPTLAPTPSPQATDQIPDQTPSDIGKKISVLIGNVITGEMPLDKAAVFWRLEAFTGAAVITAVMFGRQEWPSGYTQGSLLVLGALMVALGVLNVYLVYLK